MILPCTSLSETADSPQSAKAKWYKVKELENGFERQEFNPAARSQSSIKEAPSRRVYWASDLTESDWSIQIDSLELDDASLYQCTIKTGSVEENLLVELVVNRK